MEIIYFAKPRKLNHTHIIFIIYRHIFPLSVCGNLCGVVSEDEEVAEKEEATGEGATAKLQPDTLKPAAQRSAAGSNVTETSVMALGVSGRSGAEVKNNG